MGLASLICTLEEGWTITIQTRSGGLIIEMEHRDGHAGTGTVERHAMECAMERLDVPDQLLKSALKAAASAAASQRILRGKPANEKP